ncbi:PREDICTED: stress response protein nst1-like [Branchiostoma belcheri]|uniref:Stress response protein nst1-like n=1 Tax=Branchiostoma belcheri TaxID=7741 RepID=A0A6P4YVY5_BRABE|nr:PREDICTED: stress response protein nst1-like [Branchiostoma belcheri]
MEPMFCDECGARTKQRDNFCNHCGNQLRTRRGLVSMLASQIPAQAIEGRSACKQSEEAWKESERQTARFTQIQMVLTENRQVNQAYDDLEKKYQKAMVVFKEKYRRAKQANVALSEKHQKVLQINEKQHEQALQAKEMEHKQAILEMEYRHRLAMQDSEERHKQDVLAREERHKQDVLAREERHKQDVLAREERHKQDVLAREERHKQDFMASGERHKKDLSASDEWNRHNLLATNDWNRQAALASREDMEERHKEDLQDFKDTYMFSQALLTEGSGNYGLKDRHSKKSPKNPAISRPALHTRADRRQSKRRLIPSPPVSGAGVHIDRQQDRLPSSPSQTAPDTSTAAGVDQRQDRPPSPESQPQPSPAVGTVYVEPQPRPPSPWEEDVNCYSSISHKDIADFLRNHRERLTDTDRKLLQEAMTLVVPESNWVLNHAEITVYGEQMTVVFYSGERTNKYVVRLDSELNPIHEVEERGWGLSARDAALSGWDWTKDAVRGAVSTAAGAAAGGSLTGITSGLIGVCKSLVWKEKEEKEGDKQQ